MNWYKKAQNINPPMNFDSKEGLHQTKLGKATIWYYVTRIGNVELQSLRVPQKYRRKGYAKAILSEFIKWLDKEGFSSSLGASPLDKKTSPQMLENMYSNFGYSPTGGHINPVMHKKMKRDPKQKELNELV